MNGWGPGAAGGFQNALATGLQFGQMARARQDERDYRNAFAQFDPANPETIKPIMAVDPRAGLQLQGQVAAQQEADLRRKAAAAEKRRADLPMLTRLLDSVNDEQSYQRGLQVAQQYDIDVSNLPQQYDPQWVDQQRQTLKMLQAPEGQEILSTAGKQAFDEGLKPGTPEFQSRVTEIWQQSGAIPYTGSGGETRLYVPGRGVKTNQTWVEGQIIENDAGEQMILRNGKWEPYKGGAGSNASGGF